MTKGRGPATARKIICAALAALMAIPPLASSVSAADAVDPVSSAAAAVSLSAADSAGGTQSIASVKELLSAIPYDEYHTKYADVPLAKDKITLSVDKISNQISSAPPTIYGNNYEGYADYQNQLGKTSGKAALFPGEGMIGYEFNVPADGLYNISFDYIQTPDGKTSDIERMIRIDGKVPFKEARYITVTKTYKDQYATEDGGPGFKTDVNGNQMRPLKVGAPEWRTAFMSDSSGFYEDPFCFYLTAGTHTIQFEAVREDVIIGDINMYAAPLPPSYDDYIKSWQSKGKKEGTADISLIQAEYPAATSDIVIYPLNDRTSPITQPQDVSKIMLNSIGGDKWKMQGQWIEYKVTVPAGGEGLYQIIPRFMQSTYSGVYVSRKLYIDGEVPFREAERLRFNYSDVWQTEPLNDGQLAENGKNKRYFEFYLSEGEHDLRFEAVLGSIGDTLRRVDDSLTQLTDMYRKIRMITGQNPDQYRDYQFDKTIPEVIKGLADQSANLYDISDQLAQIIGAKGEQTVTLDKTALQLKRISSDLDLIAPGLDTLKGNLGSLGTWLLDRRNQPLYLDYISIQPASRKPPQAEANFFQNFVFEIKAFAMSFFTDYSSIGVTDNRKTDKVVSVWVETGRDQSLIMRQMIDDQFTQQTGIRANLKLVAGGSLLPATLAGVGPDVAMTGADTTINYAIRGAVLPLNDFQGDPSKGIDSFADTVKRFHPSAMVPLTFQDDRVPKDQWKAYGLPVNQNFPMLFYRKDILAEMNIEIPRTWEDLYAIIPELQKQNYQIAVGPGLGTTQMFMFQQNVPLYKGDGIAINLDDNAALDSFQKMMDLYTLYKFPIQFSFVDRFRMGEMPMGIADYASTYNTLTVSAPEIRGLWDFIPLPGTVRDRTPADAGQNFVDLGNGKIIDNKSPAGVTSINMMRTALNRKTEDISWAYMQWWTSAEAQSRFGNEMTAIMGAAAKQPTANREALNGMSWPTQDLRNLQAQFNSLSAAPEVPGSYIVGRYVDFAWKDIYNKGSSTVETLLDYLPDINKELTRKRQEFGMLTLDDLQKKGESIDQGIAAEEAQAATAGR